MQARSSDPSGSRAPAALYSALALGLVLLVASLAFTARQPPPPQIAELTPQARHPITRAPSQLTSDLGSGAGAATGAGGPATTTAAPPGHGPSAGLPGGGAPAAVAAAHHCFGSPPMQISFDTQSPPCVAYWAGDNGGATSRGVSATTVRIELTPSYFPARTARDLQNFFNRNFELYGRQLQLDTTGARPSNCVGQKAKADTVAAEGYFASDDDQGAADSCFYAEASHDHLVSVMYWPEVYLSSSVLDGLAPYVYSYEAPYDTQFAGAGAFTCSQLAGRTASYSPDPTLALAKRKFGVISIYDDTPEAPTLAPLTAALARCGVTLSPSDVESYGFEQGPGDGTEAEWAAQAARKLKADNVTTVLCVDLCTGYLVGSEVCSGASDDSYHPEWVFVDTEADTNGFVRGDWPCADEQAALLGISWVPPQVPYADEPMNEALASVDPGYQVSGTTTNFGAWKELLLLASGIQMAGPDLTPYTFERGLEEAAFPNPYSPEMEGAASFAGGGHSMTTDSVAMWWSNTAPSVYPEQGPQTWCYADAARRFTPAGWAAAPRVLPGSLATAACANTPPGVS